MNEQKSIASMLREDHGYKQMLPYERFQAYGPETLTDAELLAIIIRTGTKDVTPMQIASQVLQRAGCKESGLNCLYHISVDELCEIEGIGQVKAIKLACISELSRRMAQSESQSRLCFQNPESIATYYMEKMRHEEREIVQLICLNNQMHLLGTEIISVGTVNSSLVSTRELFISALKKGAVNMVILHNHPGGDPYPSECDRAITQKINSAGKLLDITLCDHIIIGDKKYYSFKEHEYI